MLLPAVTSGSKCALMLCCMAVRSVVVGRIRACTAPICAARMGDAASTVCLTFFSARKPFLTRKCARGVAAPRVIVGQIDKLSHNVRCRNAGGLPRLKASKR